MPPARIDPKVLRELIEEKQMQQHVVAAMLDVSKSCVERTCKRLGLKTQRTGPRGGELHPDWSGGRHMAGRYWYVWTGRDHPMATQGGYVAEHRLRMSQHLGRPLLPTEVVHHVDGDPENNDLSNLMVFQSNAEHLRHELTGRVPNYSPEGKERMREAARRRHSREKSERGD